MALVTIQRSPSVSSSPPSSEYGSSVYSLEEENNPNKSLSEYYFAVKGFAVLLPKKECHQVRRRKSSVPPADIQCHLQAILHLLRPGDTLQMAVRLESLHVGRTRYLVVVSTIGRQDDCEESCLIGVDFPAEIGAVEKHSETGTETETFLESFPEAFPEAFIQTPTIGLVLPVLADTSINLDGDGGFSVSSAGRKHIFKPISVQAMWSALQTIHKESAKASLNHFHPGGLNHDWAGFYDRNITSDQSCVNEWNAMEGLESKRPPSPDSLTNKEETELLIRSKLKEIMMSVNIDEVTSKYIRQRLEEDLAMDLFKYKSFIDKEMLTILGQMDTATQIFPHVFLGSEWNASNLEELKDNGIGFILNVTKEIDNFFPGRFEYLNIRVYDDEKTELLKHWDHTYRYISQVKEKGSKVLVHCKMGISRSASVVIAYAMKAFHLSLEDATALVRAKRSCINPNQAFTSQLKIYQGILDASRQRHNVLFRSKSETNLKSNAKGSTSPSEVNEVHQSGEVSFASSKMKPLCSSSSVVVSVSSDTGQGENGDISGDSAGYEVIGGFTSAPGDESRLQVPHSTGHGSRVHRRPRSWSPEDEGRRSGLPYQPTDRDREGNEGLTNEQAWEAHVTLVQRNLKPPNGYVESVQQFQGTEPYEGSTPNKLCGQEPIVEAVNPLYCHDADTSISTVKLRENKEQHRSVSSVKDIITEFETGLNVDLKSPVEDMRTASSGSALSITGLPYGLDVGNSDTTSGLDNNIQSSMTTFAGDTEGCSTPSSPSDQTRLNDVGRRDNSHNLPASSLKKKKDGVEGSQLQRRLPRDLLRQGSSVSLGGGTEGETDPFSLHLDRAFDREEKDSSLQSKTQVKQSPSRNSSWSSFDSNSGLTDGEVSPSRQITWGTCDTRTISDDSPYTAIETLRNHNCLSLSSKNVVSSQIPLDSSEDRFLRKRIGDNMCSSSKSDRKQRPGISQCDKRFFALPFRSNAERDNFISPVSNDYGAKETESRSTPCTPSGSDSDLGGLPLLSKSPSHNTGVKRDFKSSPQTPEHEIPLPGTVRQQMRKLELCLKQLHGGDSCCLSVPSFGRSLSSGCVCASSSLDLEMRKKIGISRSSSEKRAKTDYEVDKGTVKKITKALETQNGLFEESDSMERSPLRRSSRSLKHRVRRWKYPDSDRGLQRSHSLERLGKELAPLPFSRHLCAQFAPSELVSSQDLLNRLVERTEAQLEQLERDERDQDEISVKNLVGLFEDATDVQRHVAPTPSSGLAPRLPSPPSVDSFSAGASTRHTSGTSNQSRSLRRKLRPRSESIGEADLPPVPLRKSSLDLNFRPVPKSPNRQTICSSTLPVRQPHKVSSSRSKAPFPPEKGSQHSGTSNSLNPFAPSQGNRGGCGSQVRRRKQQGKTHPLSKLVPRENSL